ncbi:hypothetical protein Bhyg_00939 [Pseudolycoriella hygida]|uniref:Uncharacterized protein n=1 Tax=Pseudolycoriella hygida TaxID=35572 RepID=A0A9Q0S721_9DIPT|nr:hypothetical protein Bhyg_00939 [Pseudolycoriella hygida]
MDISKGKTVNSLSGEITPVGECKTFFITTLELKMSSYMESIVFIDGSLTSTQSQSSITYYTCTVVSGKSKAISLLCHKLINN